MHTALTLEQHVTGRNKVGKNQWKSYTAYLDSQEGLAFIAGLDLETMQAIARGGYSSIPNGKDLDAEYVASWARWVATQEVAPPKSHMWIKGVCVAALVITGTV